MQNHPLRCIVPPQQTMNFQMGDEFTGGSTFRPFASPQEVITIKLIGNSDDKQALFRLSSQLPEARTGGGDQKVAPGQLRNGYYQGDPGRLLKIDSPF